MVHGERSLDLRISKDGGIVLFTRTLEPSCMSAVTTWILLL